MAQDEDEKAKQAAYGESLRRTIEDLRKGRPVVMTPREFAERGAREAQEESQGAEGGAARDLDGDGEDLSQPVKSEDQE